MSEKIQTKYGKKIPWIFGNKIRLPRIRYPVYREGSMSLPSPGRSLILILTYILLFYLVSGGIYLYIRDTIAMGGDAQGNAMWLYPSTNEAFIIESIAAAFIIYLAGIGFFLLYQSTKHAYNYSYAIKIYLIGMAAILGSFIMLQYMMGVKTGTIKR
jgi:hypothetical protein